MPRKAKLRSPSPSSDSEASQDETLIQPTSEINPYEVLSLDKSATADQIKSAYRKAALKHHPDKASPEDKDEAHTKFQEIALAYAILSDEHRRKRYDTTGNTQETLDEDDDFDWVDFFRSQTEQLVSGDMIEKIKREYQGSEEEKADVLKAYEEHEGDMDVLYEVIMCSNVVEDDERFRKIIDEAIEEGKVEKYSRYAKETKSSRKKRVQKAKAEEAEAMELAEELGVKDKLFGNGTKGANGKAAKGGKKSKGGDEDALKALIQQRQKGRAEGFLDNLEAKYGGGGKNKRKMDDEPSEEAFQKNAKKSRRKA
ncbi:hypothetical protein PMZ80_008704 [Knufia obscura]|uniref:J domain-containing protein n=1 Tax=Knufia obscura TaxID=1635080 RepID=A0ABR0RFM0_9EURO|nr:hypothetical protein PMZ80_008704 [Knufia obscura]